MKNNTKKSLLFLAISLYIVAAALLHPLGITTGLADEATTLTVEKTVVPEGDEFSTRVLGLPWNLNSEPYPDFFTALKGVEQNRFSVTPDGFWEINTADHDAQFWLNWSGIQDTQRVLRMGDTRPVDADKYKLLSYYMCLAEAPKTTGENNNWAANVYWMYDRRPHNDPNNGFSNYILLPIHGLFQNDGDCELITMDLSNSSTWAKGQWNNYPNKPQGLRLDFFNQPGANIKLGWVRLTTIDLSNAVPLKYLDAPKGIIDFYASLDACNVNGIHIGYTNATKSSGTFNWGAQIQAGFSDAYPLPLPESFEPGNYHIYMKDSEGKITCSDKPLTVHQAPILEFQKPSFYSGPDFATVSTNDPWGMSNSADVSNFRGTTPPTFNNGVMTAKSLNGDPSIYFNVNGSIDTDIYRYVTLRMRINAPNKEGDDLVQRFFWWTKGEGIDHKVTEDMEIYQGWHTYSLDLNDVLVEGCGFGCWYGNPTGFRMDPHESTTKHFFEIDFMTITGIDTIDRGDPHSIKYTIPNAPGSQVTFYYDTDKDPTNGRTLLSDYVPDHVASASNMPYSVSLPFTKVFSELELYPNSINYSWDTSNTAPDTYYISADVNDGVMTTTWYSEVPVIIK